MNLTPEEKFHQEVWWILQEIKKEWLATPQSEKVEFSIRQPDKSGVIPPAERQRKLLYKLQEKRLIEIEIGDAFCIVGIDEPKKYLLSINQQRFDKFYKKWEEIDENPWFSETSKALRKEKLLKKQREEAEIRAKEIRKHFEELNERQKELKELEEHIYSRISKELIVPIQYFKTYEEIIKKMSEQLAPFRNALEEISRLQSTTKNYLTPTLQRLTAPIKQIEEQIKKVNEIYEGTKTPNVSIIPSTVLKTKQNAEIVSELRNINNKIEGLITQKSIPVKITEIPELKIKKSEAKKKPIKKTILYLNQNGDLYREPKDRYCYPMGEKSNRHRIIRFLATNKGYQFTELIARELGIESEKTIRTEIGKIRKNIEKYLKIKGKDFLQGKKESGYRINPKYKIIPRNE